MNIVRKVREMNRTRRERQIKGQKWEGAACLPDVLPLALHLGHGLLQGKLLAGRGGDLLEPVPQSVNSSIYTNKSNTVCIAQFINLAYYVIKTYDALQVSCPSLVELEVL